MFFKKFSLFFFSSGGHFVPGSLMVWVILVGGLRTLAIPNLGKLFRRCCLKIFSIFSSGGNFVQQSICLKLF